MIAGCSLAELTNSRVCDSISSGRQRRKYSSVKMFQAAHLPSAYHNKRLEDFDTENETQSAVVRWLQQFQSRGGPGNRGVLIVGEPGVGKTHLICAVLRFLLLERGLRCRYVDSFALLSELKATWEAGTGSSALMEDVCGVPILGLDELGKTRTTGWQREVLDQIISRRYDSKLTTFVVTNYGLRAATSDKDPAPPRDGNWKELLKRETLDERIGPRIYSRLMEMCRAFYVTGADRRLGAGQ